LTDAAEFPSIKAETASIDRRKPMPKIRHLAIKTKNPARLAEFYRDVFDMKVINSEKAARST
jgi:hypothetical protein